MGGGRRVPAAQYLITPNVLRQQSERRRFSAGGFLGSVTGQSWMNNVVGQRHLKEAQTALFLSDARSGEQISAVQGKASATDFGVSFSGYGRGLNSAGAYSNTPEGKVVMAAFVDALNKLVAQTQARLPPPRVATAPRKKRLARLLPRRSLRCARPNGYAVTDRLHGTWKLVSAVREDIPSGATTDMFGEKPQGVLNYSPEGRMIALIAHGNRKAAAAGRATPAEAEALYRSMLSYGGRYTVAGDVVTHHVDISWNEASPAASRSATSSSTATG